MDLTYWQEFLEFSRYMNISEAARHLHLSQPTLSNHIAYLEAELGRPLIIRGKQLHLTAAGRLFVNNASIALESYRNVVSMVQDCDIEEQRLTVAEENSSNSASRDFMLVSNGFLVEHPEVYLSQIGHSADSAAEVLEQEQCDCVIVPMTYLDKDVERGIAFERIPSIYPDQLGLWVDTHHPLASKAALHWNDLNDLKFPMSVNVPLWAAAVEQTLIRHGVHYHTRINAQRGLNSMLAVEPDEVVLFEEHTAANAYITSFTNRRFIRIDEPDAKCENYLAYDPAKVSPALEHFLAYLHRLPGSAKAE